EVYDLILAIDSTGHLVVSNTKSAKGQPLPKSTLDALIAYDYAKEPWFQKAMRGSVALVDHHESPLLPRRTADPGTHPENYHIGFAVPVRKEIDQDNVVGVVYG